jgi:ATP-binding cassette subfamily C protein LapB
LNDGTNNPRALLNANREKEQAVAGKTAETPEAAPTAKAKSEAKPVADDKPKKKIGFLGIGKKKTTVDPAVDPAAEPAVEVDKAPAEEQTEDQAEQQDHTKNASLPDGVSPNQIGSDDPLLQCLQIVAQMLDRPTTLEALSAGLPLSKDAPAPATLILRAAERAGLRAGLIRKRRVSNISQLSLPCILILKGGNACVLSDMELKRTFRRRPDCTIITPETGGESVVPLDELQEEYSGYAIFAKAEARFDRRTADIRLSSIKRWFWGTLFRFAPIYFHVLLASFVINAFGVASPLFIMNVYDRVVPNNAQETLKVLAIGVVVVYMFDFLLRNLRSYFVDVAGKNADVIIASKLFQQVMAMRMDKRPQSTGTLANNLREFESLREFFSSSTLVAIVDLPFIFIFIWVISLIGGPLAIIPLIAVPIVMIAGLILQFPLRHAVEKTYRESAQRHALLIEALAGVEAIKTAGAEGQMQGNWERLVGLTSESSRTGRIFASLSTTIAMFSTQMVTVLIVIYGVYLIGEKELTVGALVACTILTGRALAPLASIAAMLTRLQQSRIALKALDTIMQVETERANEKGFVHRDHLEGSIEFKNVDFSYPEAQIKAIDDINFKITAGEKVGIIGRIGSGKSTLGRLMMGLYEPQEGSVLVGGSDLRQVDPADLRRNVGYVAQDSYLFFGSVKENIALGARNVDDATILRAARISGVADFIERTPQGYDLPVGERGAALSGGQRQAVSIARAILLDPNVLVFDEPTSSMDNASEAAFRKKLTDIMSDKTVLMITHRGSLLQLVDRIIILDNGKVVADGPRETVMDALKQGHIRGIAN